MGFLADKKLADVEVPEDDYSIANGTYPAMIVDSKLMNPKGDLNRESWQISYRIDPEVEIFGGRYVSEFFDMDPNLPESRKVWIKRRLISLGITDAEAEELEPEDVIGTEVTVTVKNKPSADGTRMYTNVTKVEVGADTVAAAGYLDKF